MSFDIRFSSGGPQDAVQARDLPAAASIATGQSIMRHTEAFFRRMARPSGYLKTANRLEKAKAELLKARWQEAYGGEQGTG